ncbi:hypothetical protein [Labedaea rhizosphaerae]|uniref:Uncharacterized protein n=1 Tax=Labedaea rhizosphaerae TaxID=598644 RepID=A0A4R6SPD8_LABRH|nr:hypothetical protein [Labedaea rhizosphaerae]TDQ05073.1 hypothetical protein EV186_1011037 [Labedaea rhizosphaerae]
MNLEDELSKLFADKAAFDVPVADDAADTVVRGARRIRRRRRLAAGGAGALTLAAVIGVGVAAAGVGGATGSPPANPSLSVVSTSSRPTPSKVVVPPAGGTTVASGTLTRTAQTRPHTKHRTTTTEPTSTGSPPPGNPVPFGPAGFDGLTLGMTQEEAESTGTITPNLQPDSGPDCHGYDYTDFPRPAGEYSVILSGGGGITRLTSLTNAVTPEGIYAGVGIEKVHTTYPEGSGSDAEWTAPVPGNPQAQYEFLFDGGRVVLMRLELTGGSCLS